MECASSQARQSTRSGRDGVNVIVISMCMLSHGSVRALSECLGEHVAREPSPRKGSRSWCE